MIWELAYTKQAKKDAKKIVTSGLKQKVKSLLELLKEDSYQKSPPYEKLVGDLFGVYSRRINIQHRLVYQIYEEEHVIKVIRMWAHYE